MDDSQKKPEFPSAAARAATLAGELDKLVPGPSVFAGDLSALQPPDLLNFLHQGRRTGVLLALTGDVERAVVLLDGAVAWAASTSPGERFGEVICRLGILPRSTIAAALEEQTTHQPPRRLGELLSERGLLDLGNRTRALRHQVIEIFLGLLVLREGRFNFRAGVNPAQLPSKLSLDVEGLLLDGLRRLDEMEHYRTLIPSLLIPRRTSLSAPESGAAAFSNEMRALLELVDGIRPLHELAEISALGEFEATKAAFQLIQSGFLVAPDDPPKSEP